MRFGASIIAESLGWLLLIAGILGLVLLLLPPTWFVLIIAQHWGAVVAALSPFLLLVLGILLIGLGRRLREAVVQRGACRACGYDLRGSASDRCPECGLLR